MYIYEIFIIDIIDTHSESRKIVDEKYVTEAFTYILYSVIENSVHSAIHEQKYTFYAIVPTHGVLLVSYLSKQICYWLKYGYISPLA